MENVRAHVIVEGRVQGVTFRASCRDLARQVGVSGWVKNRPDRTVEAVFEGPRAAVQRMVSWCYSGPAHAKVDRVHVAWEEPTGQEEPFSIVW